MTVLLTFAVGTALLLLGKYLFRKWFNHLNIFVFSWTFYICLYELKLMRYIDLSNEVWFVMIFSSMCYLLGIITIFAARSSQNKINDMSLKPLTLDFFWDDGKTIRNLILICSTIGLIAAVFHWKVLIDKFGSIPAVIVQANIIYKLRVEGEITETIPYIYTLSYVGIFFSGIYTAYKNKITLTALFPLLTVILKDMASVGRAGIFLGFLEFIVTLFLFRYFLASRQVKLASNKANIIIALLIFTTLAVTSVSLVRSFRGSIESYKGASASLNKLKGGAIISPSMYLYFSSNIGVLSKYFQEGGEKVSFGENSFRPVYNFLSKFGVVEKTRDYPIGYYIPMWVNSATYLRELHADFGFYGVFLVPYLLGLFATFYWFRVFERGRLIDFVMFTYICLIISMSALYLVTIAAGWSFSFVFLLLTAPLIEKFIRKKQNAV